MSSVIQVLHNRMNQTLTAQVWDEIVTAVNEYDRRDAIKATCATWHAAFLKHMGGLPIRDESWNKAQMYLRNLEEELTLGGLEARMTYKHTSDWLAIREFDFHGFIPMKLSVVASLDMSTQRIVVRMTSL